MLLLLTIQGQPYVQAVRLDDSTPGYAALFAARVHQFVDPGAILLFAEVDVTNVAEHGPDDIARILAEDTQAEHGLTTDLPQRWQPAYATAPPDGTPPVALQRPSRFAEAIADYERAANVLALEAHYADKREIAEAVKKARGDVREALGEART